MAGSSETKLGDSAEKAYAAAAETVSGSAASEKGAAGDGKSLDKAEDSPSPSVSFPSKDERGDKSAKRDQSTSTQALAAGGAGAGAPIPAATKVSVPGAEPKSAIKPSSATKSDSKNSPAPEQTIKLRERPNPPKARREPSPSKSAGKASSKATVLESSKKPALARKQPVAAPMPLPTDNSNAAPKTAQTKATIPPRIPTRSQNKDQKMDTTSNFADSFKGVMAESQLKAQEAFEKSTAMLGEYSDFAKGNVEALVESGKVLATGLQDMSSTVVTESRSAFETITADVRELAAAKSPTDFFKLQSELMRRSFDNAMAYSSKSSEAMLKLASEAFTPISGRLSVAVDKVRQPAV